METQIGRLWIRPALGHVDEGAVLIFAEGYRTMAERQEWIERFRTDRLTEGANANQAACNRLQGL